MTVFWRGLFGALSELRRSLVAMQWCSVASLEMHSPGGK